MKKIAIIANGSIANYDHLKSLIQECSSVIAADGGLSHCRKMNINPAMILGDFDSVNQEDLLIYQDVPRKIFPKDKDLTDLEICVETALLENPDQIILFGALEKRMDHSLLNLNLVYRYPEKIIIETNYEQIFAITSKKEIQCHQAQNVSLLPLNGPAIGVTTRGLKWELQNRTIDHRFLSISNVCLDRTFTVSILSGTVLCYLIK